MRVVASGVLAVSLLAAGGPVAAQDEVQASLCLSVAVPATVTSVDAEQATAMIGSGEMRILDVVPCSTLAQTPGPTPRVATTPTPMMGTTYGEWFASEVRPDAADGTTAIAGMNAVVGASSMGVPIVLAVRCHDDAVELIVTWNDPVSDEQPIVEFRAGSGATETQLTRRSADQFATFFPPGDAERYVRSLFGEASLTITLIPTDGPRTTAEFAITGIRQAMANIWTACGIE